MDRLYDLIQIYDDVLEPKFCQVLIEKFEKYSDYHERIENEKKPNFTQLNLTKLSDIDELKPLHQYLIQKVVQYKEEYYQYIDSRCFPSSNAFEQFRIKRYNNDGSDEFDCHVDVTDYESARRYLSFLFYLNDVDEGGETIFKDTKIKPKTGKLMMFPPLWMYPHIGTAPISNSKYILTTYLHYK
jgi:prolyl 4-hydroxylase